jgi:steroid 5-alpha reductase family enzyme
VSASALTELATAALLPIALMAVLWAIHLRIRNAAIVDFGWAFGLALLALWYAAVGPGYAPRRWLMATLAGLWGFRLAFYLLRDRVIGQPEEGRYQQLRRQWKTNLPLKFFFFFEFQALLCVALSLPFFLAARNPAEELSLLEYGAAALWLIAFLGEATADAQLARFKADPANRGKVCRAGLWNYSRHPNYFFEWLIWVSFALFASASPWGWTAWFAPALMLYFLFRVTGIPATEAQALRSRGEAYRRYQETTSAFVPWFPRKDARC